MSAVPAVRRLLVARQRELVAAADAVVVEGRDIGTVVLPDATAEDLPDRRSGGPRPAAGRAARTSRTTDKIAALAEDLRRRDEYDSRRADSPLRPAEDAIVVDSTELDRRAVVARILELAASAVGAGEPA